MPITIYVRTLGNGKMGKCKFLVASSVLLYKLVLTWADWHFLIKLLYFSLFRFPFENKGLLKKKDLDHGKIATGFDKKRRQISLRYIA